MGSVLALVDDFFFQTRILGMARQVGVEVKTVSTGAALVAAVHSASETPALLIVDLNAREGALEAIEHMRASGNPAPVIGFLSHVQTELAERARAAGCTEVMPRSKFTKELAAILERAKKEK